MDDYETVLLIVKEVNVYRYAAEGWAGLPTADKLTDLATVLLRRIPPRQTSRGYRASDWDETQHLWTGRLKLVANSTVATIRLEDRTSGDVFAISPYDPKQSSPVESVADSSRYFVLRIVDPGSGQHAFVGLGFLDRAEAFDFNVALQEFAT
ncbi:Adaptin ear-binding coat-associated protein 2 [Thoreauomyces humboldtii]|nr:Adaptin ear-binding coat-associated protein 2 [Thoreauomyces humboldtii]